MSKKIGKIITILFLISDRANGYIVDWRKLNKMCDQLDRRGCEIVDELHLEITNLEMTIADLKSEIVEDLERSPLNASHIEAHESYMMKLSEKWEAK